MCVVDQGVILLEAGHFWRRVFKNVLDIREAPGIAFDPAGTEVATNTEVDNPADRTTRSRLVWDS